MGFGVYRSGSTLATSLTLANGYPGSVFESLPVSSNGTQYRLAPSPAPYFSLARPFHLSTLCLPILIAFLLISLVVIYPSQSHDHDSTFRPCNRLHAVFTKAGLEPPLPPSLPAKRHPIFRVHIAPAPLGLLHSRTGSVHGRRHRHRSRLPGPDLERAMEDIWESPEEGQGGSSGFDYFPYSGNQSDRIQLPIDVPQ